MKVRRVIATGCSFVEGSNILDKDGKSSGKKYRASKIIAKRYCAEELNIALPGAGNDYIINLLVDKLINLKDTEGTFVIIGLSGITRREYFIENIGAVRNLHLFDILNNPQNLPRRAKLITGEEGREQDFYNFIEFKAKYLFNLDFEKQKLRNKLLMLDSFLKSRNIPYVLFNSIEDNIIDIKEEINYMTFTDEMPNNHEDIKALRRTDFYESTSENKPTFEDTLQQFLTFKHHSEFNNTFRQEDRSPSYPYGKFFCGSHPSPNANILLANKIEKYIQNNFDFLEPDII